MLMVSLERFTTIRRSGRAEPPRPTKCGTARSLALLVIFAVLFNLPKIWELQTCRVRDQEEDMNSTSTKFGGELRLEFSEIYVNSWYRSLYRIGANILVHWMIPLVSLVYLNIGIYLGVS